MFSICKLGFGDPKDFESTLNVAPWEVTATIESPTGEIEATGVPISVSQNGLPVLGSTAATRTPPVPRTIRL